MAIRYIIVDDGLSPTYPWVVSPVPLKDNRSFDVRKWLSDAGIEYTSKTWKFAPYDDETWHSFSFRTEKEAMVFSMKWE